MKINNSTNKYGANQFHLDPRQKLCWDSYINPKSKTFGNAKQSAIKAGYEVQYAETITVTEWFLVKVRRLNMVQKAERNLDEVLDMKTKNEEGKEIPDLLRIKVDVSKTVTTTLGKNEGWSNRQEVTGAEGSDLRTIIISRS